MCTRIFKTKKKKKKKKNNCTCATDLRVVPLMVLLSRKPNKKTRRQATRDAIGQKSAFFYKHLLE
jgi:hypothetical protein